jgi:hypothetical protein
MRVAATRAALQMLTPNLPALRAPPPPCSRRFSLKRAAAEAEADDVGGPSAWKSDTGVSAAPRRRALFAAASNAFASGPAAAGGGSGSGSATPPGGGGDALGEDAATSTASTATVASSGPKSTLSAS